MGSERYRIGDLTVDVGAAEVSRDGEVLHVTGLSFNLLVVFARRAPDVVDYDTLAAEVWGLEVVSDETVMQRVALLRRAVGDEASKPKYVRSVRGRGYGLVPEVRELDQQPSSLAPWKWAAVAALIALPLAYVMITRGDSRSAEPSTVTTAPLTATEMVRQADRFVARHRETDNEMAIELYEKSLELEPDHPRALVGLSFGLSQRVSKFNHPIHEAERALELAERRLASASDDPSAHYARGFALDSLGRVGPAIDSYLRASALDPENRAAAADAAYLQMVRGDLAESLKTSLDVLAAGAELHYLELEIGWDLALLGFDSAAAIWLQRALDLWPDSIFAGSTFARFRLYQGHLQEAQRIAEETLALGVDRAELPTILGHVALLRGDRDEAIRRYEQANEINPRVDPAKLRLLVLERSEPGAVDRYEELVREIRSGVAAGDEWPGTVLEEMLLHAGFGEFDAALVALDQAIDLGYRESAWLMLDPLLAELRAHPGFVERIERIALEIERERQEVLAAPWLPADLLDPGPSAAG